MKRFLLLLPLLVLLLAASSGFAGMSNTPVQVATANTGATSTNTLSVTMTSAPTAGNFLIITIGGGSDITITPVAGITWSGVGVASTTTANRTFIGRVFAGASATITATQSNSSGIALVVAEYTGTNTRLDQVNTTSSTATTSPSITNIAANGNANEMEFGGFCARLASGLTYSAPTNGFTLVGQATTTIATTSDRSVALLSKLVSATETAAPGVTVSASAPFVAEVMTVEETPTSGGGPTQASYTYGP